MSKNQDILTTGLNGQLELNGVKFHPSISRAFTVFLLTHFPENMITELSSLEVASNCREQLLVLKRYEKGNDRQVVFGENRNSDCTVIYYGRSTEFYYCSNLPTKWDKVKYFGYDQLQEAADFIQDYLTN